MPQSLGSRLFLVISKFRLWMIYTIFQMTRFLHASGHKWSFKGHLWCELKIITCHGTPTWYTTLLHKFSFRPFGSCAYEAELGQSEESAKFMKNFLEDNNWLDRDTTVAFIDQTFLNIALSAFVMFRLELKIFSFNQN